MHSFERGTDQVLPVIKYQLVDQDTMVAMQQVGEKHGVKVSIVAKPGEHYTREGSTFAAGQNEYYVSFEGPKDLSQYWDEVDRLAPHKKDAITKTVDELLTSVDNGTLEPGEAEWAQHLVEERIKNTPKPIGDGNQQ